MWVAAEMATAALGATMAAALGSVHLPALL
jgi:hypothetical protein